MRYELKYVRGQWQLFRQGSGLICVARTKEEGKKWANEFLRHRPGVLNIFGPDGRIEERTTVSTTHASEAEQ